MKSFFLVLAVFVVVQALTDEQKEKLRNHGKLCIKETGVDKAEVQKVRGGDYSADDEHIKAFALCMLKKIQLVNADGKFDKKVALEKVADDVRDKVSAAMDKCINSETVVTPEIAWSYAKCYHAERPDHAVF